MKKLFPLLSVAICASLLLSSCSRLKDFSITKRHYRSGYTVDFGSPKQDVKANPNNSKSVKTESPSSNNTIADNKNSNISDGNDQEVSQKKDRRDSAPAFVVSREEKKKEKHNSPADNVYASKNNFAVKEEVKLGELEKQNTLLSNSITDTSGPSAETPMWLLIVFCILLPPLAVGLKFGIIDKFWISCLLTVLFWIPGVVYALIVVTRE